MKKRYIALGAIGILSVAGVAGFVATSLVSKASAAVAETIAPALPPPERIEVSRQAMVKALEQKVEITSASMYLDKYVPGGVCGENAWQRFMYNNCVTMLVTAKVNAGFDWKAVTAQQITADHERVTVDLGSPKILDVVTIHDKT